jgi:hypothetical protein
MANSKATNMNKFIIEYEYFGLSNSAEVKKRTWRSEPYYKCFLHSSAQEIDIKQEIEAGVSYWIDMSVGSTTPLSQILGAAIENKLNLHQL